MDYKRYDLDHLQSMRSGVVIQKQMGGTPELIDMLETDIILIGREIAKRLQITLDFQQEPEDGAYAD